MDHPFSLKDKIYLVTGATSGIGLETCKVINQMGGSVIGVGRNLANFRTAFPDEKNKCIEYDLMNLDGIESLADQVDKIDGFVHAAGIVDLNLIRFFKPDLYNQIRVTNLDSFIFLLSQLLRKKKIKNGGSIVIVSSISGIFGMKGNGLYAMTKAALNIAAKTYAGELAGQKIRINTVAPGMVRTQITNDAIDTFGEDQIKIDEAKYPLGYGFPEDVANPIAFLLSDAAKWITGEVMVIDGGRTAAI
jgi:NAD(P)-dependent dehydrogenase (short-subunit alcohol dehydrogenase family)